MLLRRGRRPPCGVTGPGSCGEPLPGPDALRLDGLLGLRDVSIPSLTQPNGITSYDGTILAPADGAAFPGARPVVLIQHGLGGNQCANWWTAQDVAGHGYVAMVWTAPQGSSPTDAFANAVDAMRSALAFTRTAANPYSAQTDAGNVALAGHSLGSIVAGYVQQDPDPGIHALIALDTLRRWLNGDPGGAVFECTAAQNVEITPRVPALGFAKDQPCDARPDYAPLDLKLAGFLHWREAGMPAMELDMAGYNHLDFATPGSEDKHRVLSYFIGAWLDRWLQDDGSADQRLLADTVLGMPTASLLSTQFHSGAFLPGKVDSTDYRAYLSDTKAPNTKRRGGPQGSIGRDRARRGSAVSLHGQRSRRDVRVPAGRGQVEALRLAQARRTGGAEARGSRVRGACNGPARQRREQARDLALSRDRLGLGDRRAADHEVAVEQARGLARRDSVGRLGQLQLELIVRTGARQLGSSQASAREW